MRCAHAGIGRRALVVDGLVACAALVLVEVEVVANRLGSGAAVLGAAAALALAARRLRPVAAFAVTALVVPVLDDVLGSPWGAVANAPVFLIVLSACSVGAHAPPRRSAAAVGGAVAAFALAEAISGGSDYLFLAFVLVVPWLAGMGVRAHRAQTERLRALARRLDQERAISERVAVERERQRIAYETDDGIGHAVSEMALQAAGAQELLVTDPERARRALAAVQETGRTAVAQLQGVLGTLHAGEAPAPGEEAEAPPAPRGPWRPWPAALDLPLALAVLAAGAVAALTERAFAGDRPAALAIQAVAALAVALHLARPAAALVLALAAWSAETALLAADPASPAPAVAVLLVTYSVAARARGWARVAAVVGGSFATPLVAGLAFADDDAADVLLPMVLVAVSLTAGLVVAGQRRRSERLALMAVRLRRERDARARLATLAERARMAHDLHDSVAHAVSVMVLQAGAAEAVLDRDPAQARPALAAIQAVAREALRDLGALLGVLATDDAAPMAPAPGLADVQELVATVRRAGLPVRLEISGTPRGSAPDVEQAAYRILQEGLTNALKHSGGPTAVRIRHGDARIELEVLSTGARHAGASSGHGLTGMRERAAHHRGTFSAGPTQDGGFAVAATLPTAPERRQVPA